MNLDAKILNKILGKLNSTTCYKAQLSIVPRMKVLFNICKSLNVIQHINRSKEKKTLKISIDAQKPSIKFNILS
jgi:hypothetical protein